MLAGNSHQADSPAPFAMPETVDGPPIGQVRQTCGYHAIEVAMPRPRKQPTASITEAPTPIKQENGSIELRLTRTLIARPEDIFDLWLDWKSAGSPWFGAAKTIVQPVVDGLFYHCVRLQGEEWPHYGRFITLDRPSLIRHSWVSEATRGMESTVTLSIEPEGDRTRINLEHSNLPDDAMGRRHEEGWGFVLQMLVEHLRRK